MAAVVTVKVAEVAFAGTAVDAGTVNVALVFDKMTVTPPAGAALVRATVQLLDELGPRMVGLQEMEETETEATRLMVVLAELLL